MLLAPILGPLTISDLVIIALVLIFAIVGIKKGFLNQIIGLLVFVATVIASVALCSQLKDIIVEKTTWLDKLSTWIANNFKLENITVAIDGLKEKVADLKLPEFLVDAIVKYAESLSTNSVNFSETVSTTLANYILLAGSFIVIFIAASIIGIIIKKILKFIVDHTPVKVIDKLLGFILGIVKGAIAVSLIVFLIQLLNFSGIEVIKQDIADSFIANIVYNSNLFQWALSFIPFI